MPSERVAEQLKNVPTGPGVYLVRDGRGQVLYVGKAKSLRPRVRSYFQARGRDRPTISQLPDRVHDVEVIVTQSEVEALHLEQNLVKRHRPPFNVRLREHQPSLYVVLSVYAAFPPVVF